MQLESPQLIIALDYAEVKHADVLVAQLDPRRVKLKVGKELFTRAGPDFIKQLVSQGFDVFLDLKFHDIPHTVAKACQAAADLGVWMLNVHALGGRHMLAAAQQSLQAWTDDKPLLVAVTILTSMSIDELNEVGLTGTVSDYVSKLALLAQDCGLDGVVCSAQEAQLVRNLCGPEFCLVSPGIKVADQAGADQRRTSSVTTAINNGVDYIVIGRAVTQAEDPLQVIKQIELDIEQCAAGGL